MLYFLTNEALGRFIKGARPTDEKVSVRYPYGEPA